MDSEIALALRVLGGRIDGFYAGTPLGQAALFIDQYRKRGGKLRLGPNESGDVSVLYSGAPVDDWTKKWVKAMLPEVIQLLRFEALPGNREQ